MTWKASLEGHEFDLQALTELFREGDPLVGHDPAIGYYIEAAVLENQDHKLNHAAAEPLVRRVNGIARATASGYRPVRLTGRYTGPNGEASIVLGAETIEGRSRVSAGSLLLHGVAVSTPPPKGPRYAKLAEGNADVADVLRVLGQPDRNLDWYDIYKAWEIVQHAVGGAPVVVARGFSGRPRPADCLG